MIKTACPTTLNLPYSEREIKIEGFGGRHPFGGLGLGPWPHGPSPKLGPDTRIGLATCNQSALFTMSIN